MFRLLRLSKPPTRPFTQVRSYAKPLSIVGPDGLPPKEQIVVPPEKTAQPRMTVDPNHGLYHFFRKKPVEGVWKYETLEPPEIARSASGRSWTAAELRLKSFQDLHTLWYVLVRERNLLATQKEEARRLGVPNPHGLYSQAKMFQCRKSMARIKFVINERRLAYEGAIELIEEEKVNYFSKPSRSLAEINLAKAKKATRLARSTRQAKNRFANLRKTPEELAAHLEKRNVLRGGGERKPRWTNEQKKEAEAVRAARMEEVEAENERLRAMRSSLTLTESAKRKAAAALTHSKKKRPTTSAAGHVAAGLFGKTGDSGAQSRRV